jgi:hypothetical protein
MREMRWLLMASPSPVPPYRREVDESAWTNGWKIRSSLSTPMPTPVSETSNRITVRAPSLSARTTRTTISPLSVNLIALPMRFVSTCRIRPGSPRSTAGTEGSVSTTNSSPLVWAGPASRSATSSTTVRRSNSMSSI